MLTLPLIALAFAAQTKTLSISIQLAHYPQGKLYMMDGKRHLDSIQVSNGVGVFRYVKQSPDVEEVRIYDPSQKEVRMNLLLENKDIRIQGQGADPAKYAYTGTQSQVDYLALMGRLESYNQNRGKATLQPAKTDSLKQNMLGTLASFIAEHPDAYVSAITPMMYLYNRSIDKVTAIKWYDALTDRNKRSPAGVKTYEMIQRFGVPKSGEMLNLDITLRQTDGKPVKLSDQSGNKKLLLIYWASWCGPCLAEIPELKKFYAMQGKEVQMVSISLDTNKDEWLKMSAQQGMPWLNVSDLQGFSSPAAQLFSIGGIPKIYLVGKDRKLIGEVDNVLNMERRLSAAD